MQPDDLTKKLARRVASAGTTPLAHLAESVVTNEKIETLNEKIEALVEEVKKKELLEYDIQIDEEARVHLKGEKGDKGDQGEKGETGSQGEKGERGERGERGEPGADGRDGKNGVDGKDGKDGKDAVLGDLEIKDVKELPETIATLQNRTQLLNQMISTRGGVSKIVAGTNVTISPSGGTGEVTINATGGGGISDGDKGDITVSGGGTVWEIDASTVGVTELSATGTPSSTTFLRGDNTWATPAGGSSGLTIGTTTITSGANKRLLYDDVGVVGETDEVIWDKTDQYLRIGAGTGSFGGGTEKLQVDGTIYLQDQTVNGGDGVLKLITSKGLQIDAGATGVFRLLPFGNHIYFQNTNSSGDINFTGLNGGALTGDTNFYCTGVVRLSAYTGTPQVTIGTPTSAFTSLTIQGRNDNGWVGLKIESADGVAPAVFSGQVTTLYGYIGSGYYYSSGQFRTDNTAASNILFKNDGSMTFLTDSSLTGGVSYTPTTRMSLLNNGNLGINETTPTSILHTGGAIALPTVAKTSNYTAVNTDSTILGDATGGAVTITLPTATGCSGRVYVIKKVDSSGNAVVIDGAGSETIDGVTTKSMTTQYDSYVIQSDGSNWFSLAKPSVAGSGSFAVSSAEIDFGSVPVKSKRITVTDASITTSSKIMVTPDGAPATGRVGNDWEWDTINFSVVPGTGNFLLTGTASGRIKGKRRIFYTYS